MRILSQDTPMINAFDIPYEMTMFSMSKYAEGRYRIYAQGTFIGNTSDDNFVLMSEYSTEAKARKAMEMLREAYCGAVYMKHADYDIDNINLSQELEKKIREEMLKPHFLDVKIKNPVIECKVFRFPTDDEVEV